MHDNISYITLLQKLEPLLAMNEGMQCISGRVQQTKSPTYS